MAAGKWAALNFSLRFTNQTACWRRFFTAGGGDVYCSRLQAALQMCCTEYR